MSIGKRIKIMREKINLTQEEFADKVRISRSALANYECGAREPKGEILVRMADNLGTTTDYLLGRTEELSQENKKPKQPDLEAPYRQKNPGDAYLKISELAYEYNLPDELVLSLIKKVREKYGPLPAPVVDSKAAHGPRYPGSGAFTKEDLEEKDDKGNDEQNPASKPDSRRSKNKNKI